MPINESKAKPKERWPLEFDLEGIPRDTALRKKLLQERFLNNPVNTFATDTNLLDIMTPQQKEKMLQELLNETSTAGQVIDLANPPVARYQFREFPKMLYNHDSGAFVTVADERQAKAAMKKGFQVKPSPNHDYSNVANGKAALKGIAAPRETDLSAEVMAELEAQDAQ